MPQSDPTAKRSRWQEVTEVDVELLIILRVQHRCVWRIWFQRAAMLPRQTPLGWPTRALTVPLILFFPCFSTFLDTVLPGMPSQDCCTKSPKR